MICCVARFLLDFYVNSIMLQLPAFVIYLQFPDRRTPTPAPRSAASDSDHWVGIHIGVILPCICIFVQATYSVQ